MHLFRRDHRDESSAPALPVVYNPPPDGSYPPRLLSALSTIWVADGSTITLPEMFSLTRRGSKMTLIPDQATQHKLRINAQPVYLPHRLMDGDFVQHRNDVFIFQADPVADRRRRLQAEFAEHPLVVTPSARLRQFVDLTSAGISVDQGQTYIPWEQISSLEYIMSAGDLRIHLADTVKPVKARVKGRDKDLNTFYLWLYLVLPFDITIYTAQSGDFGKLRQFMPDAYAAAILEKVIVPAEEGTRTLPAGMDVLSGGTSCYESAVRITIGWVAINVLLFVIRNTIQSPLIETFLPLITLISVGLVGLTLYSEALHQWRKYQRRRAKARAAKSAPPADRFDPATASGRTASAPAPAVRDSPRSRNR